MPSIHHFLHLLHSKLGQPYDLHIQVPTSAHSHGPWNCSALVAWALWQAGDHHRLGCRHYAPPKAQTGGWVIAEYDTVGVWAWTEWFYEDLQKHAIRVTEKVAVTTPGVIGLYRPHELSDHPIGHIAVSLGHDRIIEAHGARHAGPHGNTYGPDPGVIATRKMEHRFRHWYKLKHFHA